MAALGAMLSATGCGGSAGVGSGANCSITSCTVTFQRGVTASTSILGVKAELVAVKDSAVTVNVGGQTISLPSDGTRYSSDGLKLSVTSVTKDRVVLKISRA
jgi:hypothetical protein